MSLDNFVPDLSRPTTTDQLARALGVATAIFDLVTGTDDPEKLYRKHHIPKKVQQQLPSTPVEDAHGFTVLSLPQLTLSQYRIAWEPWNPVVKFAHRSAAKVIGRYLSRHGSGFPHPCAYGYIKGRSTRMNAREHVGARLLLSADIQNFFPSISTARIELALCKAGIRTEVAGSLARFFSIDGALPLGLNASPLLANLVAYPLDEDLLELAKRTGCSYTRYADDLTFSGNDCLPTRDEIEAILRRQKFRLNKQKFRLSKRGQRHYVTGLSVSDPLAPHTPRKMKHHLRRELHFIDKFGLDHHLEKLRSDNPRQQEINRIDGTVSYVASIEPRLAPILREKWTRICEREQIGRSFEPRPVVNLRRARWFIDEAEAEKPDGTKVLALCLADVLETKELETGLERLFSDEAGDAFGPRSGIEIAKKGIHWATATLSQQERVVNLLSTSPIRVMVAMEAIHPGGYLDAYIRLLSRLLDTAMRTADDAVVSIVVESNSAKVSQPRIRDAVSDAYSLLEADNKRRPMECPTVAIESKGTTPAMCVPDIFLGALFRYAKSRAEDDQTGALAVACFERLRNRYAVMFDDQQGVVYHSRNPFRRWDC